MDICDWKGCNLPPAWVYCDEWLLCERHAKSMRTMDEIESGLRIGVLGGIFAGFLTSSFG